MADAFALLGLPPRAALDPETLQAAYLAATRAAHPDQAGGDAARAAELNRAQETLQSPVSRLKHLIEEHSDTPWRAIPLEAGLMALFERLGPLLQAGGGFVKRKQAAASALARALLAGEEMTLRESLEALGLEIETHWQTLESALPGLDARLERRDPAVWAELQALQARFAYLAKWRAQIRELLLQLML